MDETALKDLLEGVHGRLGTKPSLRTCDASPPSPSQERPPGSMFEELRTFNRWVAGIYKEFSQEARRSLLSRFAGVEEMIDDAFRRNDWAAFQKALANGRAIVTELQEREVR